MKLHHQHIGNNRLTDFTADEYIALLADHDWEDRQNKKMARLINGAAFKQLPLQSSITAMSATFTKTFIRLATLDFIRKKENFIITGPSVVGKVISFRP